MPPFSTPNPKGEQIRVLDNRLTGGLRPSDEKGSGTYAFVIVEKGLNGRQRSAYFVSRPRQGPERQRSGRCQALPLMPR